MSVVIETTLGDITVDLFLAQRPRACLNFLKLCKMKYYNFNLFHTISRGFIAQTGDPTGSRSGGESIFGLLEGPSKRFFEGENEPRIKHTRKGLISFVGNEERMIGSQFFITLGEDLTYLDEKHCVFGEVVEGNDVLEEINEAICDTDDRPYQDIRITHTVILDDPYADPKMLRAPSRSPSPSAERLQGGRIAPDENVDETEGKTIHEIAELQAEREAKARATILEMVGDLPAAEMAPPENVLFVCKLNPVTTDDDLEIIFNRFGKIKSCEIIRDRKTNDSLQYAFIEFEDEKSCEDAYFKMDNVLIDDRRIHVDFSQSVSKLKWHGKGRGVSYYDHKGKKTNDYDNEIGKGNYKISSNRKNDPSKYNSRSSDDPKKDSERYKREKSHSKSPSRARDTPERSKRQPALKRSRRDNNSRMDHSQPRSVKRVSRSHSRSPRRQPSGSNDRRGSPRRREEHRSSTFGRDQAKHIRNEVHSRNRDRSRSPAYVRKSSHDNRSRSDKVTSRSSHNEAYSKSDRNTRNETNQSRKDKSPNSEKRSTEESRKRSHRKIKKDIDKSENKSKTDKTIQSKSETGNVKKNKYSKSSEKENGKNNKEQKRRKNSDKDRNKRRQKKSKESSDSSTSSSSSDSSSHSSSSDSSDSSSESDSSDSEIEKKKRRKTKKRTESTSSDSDTDRSRSKSRKKKKKTVHRSDSSSSSEDSKRGTKKIKRKR